MQGNATRIGLMLPSSNTMIEADFAREVPDNVTVHSARMFMEDTTAAGEYRMLDEFAMPAARDLGTAHPDVIVFGCTSAGALRGNDYDAELCERISEASGASAVSTIQSVRDAILSSGAKRVGVITPYVEELNEKIKASIEADGIEVVKIAGLGMTENFQIARVPHNEIVDFAEASMRGLDIELVFASCTNFGAMQAIPAIVQRLGLPTLSSNQAVIAAALARLASLTSHIASSDVN